MAAAAGIGAFAGREPVFGLVAGALGLLAAVVAVSTTSEARSSLEGQNRRGPSHDLQEPIDERVSHRDVEQPLEHTTPSEVLSADLVEARARIRELEGALEQALPVGPPEVADNGGRAALTDGESQLFSEAYFRVALDARIAAARRHLRPVAVALLEINEGAGSLDSPAPPSRAAESIRETVRDADTACRLSDGTYAIILEDTPENGAVWTVERVRRNIVSRFGNHTMWAGVACYPAHAFSTEELLDQAHSALSAAKEWKQDRIEVAISE